MSKNNNPGGNPKDGTIKRQMREEAQKRAKERKKARQRESHQDKNNEVVLVKCALCPRKVNPEDTELMPVDNNPTALVCDECLHRLDIHGTKYYTHVKHLVY